jgi:hypothetical protein
VDTRIKRRRSFLPRNTGLVLVGEPGLEAGFDLQRSGRGGKAAASNKNDGSDLIDSETISRVTTILSMTC